MPKKKQPIDLPKEIQCSTCLGKGEIENPLTIGETLKAERQKAGIPAKAIAARMELPASTFSELEKRIGGRHFTEQQALDYRAAIKAES